MTPKTESYNSFSFLAFSIYKTIERIKNKEKKRRNSFHPLDFKCINMINNVKKNLVMTEHAENKNNRLNKANRRKTMTASETSNNHFQSM